MGISPTEPLRRKASQSGILHQRHSHGHRRGQNSLAAAGNVGEANGLLQCQRSIPEMFEPNILCFASEGKVLQLQTVMRTVQICYAKLAEQKVS